MAYITNGGARLIERAKKEGKSIVFGSVRMNTIYKSDPSSLVQKSDKWFGANHGEVVGCLSHVSVDDVSCVCDSKLAIQCNDNSESWKSLGIYAHLDGEEGETLLACESIQNGEYKDVTLVELPVTLDGVVEDFGLSEGGGGGGGGGDVPENMMTTNTEQVGLSGTKTWEKQSFIGKGSAENPEQYDLLNVSRADIGNLDGDIVEGRPLSYPIKCSNTQQVREEDKWIPGRSSYAKLSPLGVLQLNSGETVDDEEHVFRGGESLEITPNGVQYENQFPETLSATWNDIINAANSGGGGGGDIPANMMTTNTEQVGLSGMKTWTWNSYEGEGTVDEPQDGDIRINESISIDSIEGNHIPLALDRNEDQYSSKDGWYARGGRHLRITSDGVEDLDGSNATWDNIIKAAKYDIRASQDMVQDDKGTLMIFGRPIQPSSGLSYDGLVFTFNGYGYLESVYSASGSGIATIGVIVLDENGNMVANSRVSGFSMNSETPLTFQSPIQLQQYYSIIYQAIFSTPNSYI